MSRQEQAALIAWLNSFRPSRRITTFDSLADGRAFMDVLNYVDAAHFKNASVRGPGAGPSSPDNWVLKINGLKRLYRLLVSYPLPAPHHPLSTSTLPEPPYSTIVKAPSSPEGSTGLVQLARMVLCAAVWAPGNEKVIAKIQGLGEGHMAELMRAIEEVMATMPPEDEDGSGQGGEGMLRKMSSNGSGGVSASASRRGSPVKKGDQQRAPSPPGALRTERDRLVVANDELRLLCEQKDEQLSDITATLAEIKAEKDEALARLTASREAGQTALSKSQGASSSVESLKAELARVEEVVARLEDELQGRTTALDEAEKAMVILQEEVAEAAGMRDQLDEYRHLQSKLQKSEMAAEKYKKKLEEMASVKRELRNLEEENAQLLSINAGLEGELRDPGKGSGSVDGYRRRLEASERKRNEQATELSSVQAELHLARDQLLDSRAAHERDVEELQLYQQRDRNSAMPEESGDARKPRGNLGGELESIGSPGETKTDLKLRIRKLERQLAISTRNDESDRDEFSLLSAAQRARDRYQAEYLASHRQALWLQAKVDAILQGKSGPGQMASALRVELDEVNFERKQLEDEVKRVRGEQETVKRELKQMQEDLELVDKDERDILEALRRTARADLTTQEGLIRELRDQIEGLKEKDALRLEEIKLLLSDKIDLQSAGIGQRDEALKREMEFGDLRSQLAAERSRDPGSESEPEPDYAAFEEAQQAYEAQISALKTELDTLKTTSQRVRLEQDLMLSAWHDLGSRVIEDQLGAVLASHAQMKRSQPKAAPLGWLGRQRRAQEDAIFRR